jgi:uncharacterized protein (TIGR01615 family)
MFALSLRPSATHASFADKTDCPPASPATPPLPRTAPEHQRSSQNSSIFTPTKTSRLAAPQGWFERSVAAQVWEIATAVTSTNSTANLAARLRSDGFAARSVRVTSHMLPWAGPSSSPGSRKTKGGMTLERLLVLVDVPTRSFSACVVVDTSFSQAFQPPPPRASEQCLEVLASLPEMYVGSDSSLLQLLKYLAAVIEDSYTAACLSVPPWRTEAALLRAWGLGEDVDDNTTNFALNALMAIETLDNDVYDGQ